jgi:hypothetical protein
MTLVEINIFGSSVSSRSIKCASLSSAFDDIYITGMPNYRAIYDAFIFLSRASAYFYFAMNIKIPLGFSIFNSFILVDITFLLRLLSGTKDPYIIYSITFTVDS